MMKINVKFEKNWSLKEISAYANNPNDDKYNALDYDTHLELAACAEQYAEGLRDVDSIHNEAECSVNAALEEFFFQEMVGNYIEACNNAIRQ